MNGVIEYLINFYQRYSVIPEIRFENDIGCMWVVITLNKGDKYISRRFYYVPVGTGSYDNFVSYNPHFEMEIEEMVKRLIAESEMII